MILTEKANTDFITWINDNYYPSSSRMSVMSTLAHEITTSYYALIIEWFDSVGIGIDTYTSLKTKNTFEYGCDIIATFDISPDNAVWNGGLYFRSRNEAKKLVIEKANEIYNSKFNK